MVYYQLTKPIPKIKNQTICSSVELKKVLKNNRKRGLEDNILKTMYKKWVDSIRDHQKRGRWHIGGVPHN